MQKELEETPNPPEVMFKSLFSLPERESGRSGWNLNSLGHYLDSVIGLHYSLILFREYCI